MARQSFVGLVISQGKMNKTIKVRVKKVKHNRVIHKDIVEYRDFMVHDELNKCQEGDVVRIQYVRPLSTRKSFAVAEIMKYRGTEWKKYADEAPGKVGAEELEKLQEYKKEREQRIAAQGTSVVAEELRTVERHLAGATDTPDSETVSSLLEKYKITQWPPSHEIVSLDASQLRRELANLRIEITARSYSSQVRQMLTDEPDRANSILESLGHEPASMKDNIKKNILMKHFAKQFNAA